VKTLSKSKLPIAPLIIAAFVCATAGMGGASATDTEGDGVESLGPLVGLMSGMSSYEEQENEYCKEMVYGNVVRKQILSHWKPIRGTKTPLAVIGFQVYPDGRLTKVRLEDSSGDKEVDQAAVRAVKDAAPFPPFAKYQFKPQIDPYWQCRFSFAGEMPESEKLEHALSEYYNEVSARITGKWHPQLPEKAPGATVAFRITKEGKLRALFVQQTSGNKREDAAAVKAIEDCEPFAPLPKGAPNTVRFEFTTGNYTKPGWYKKASSTLMMER